MRHAKRLLFALEDAKNKQSKTVKLNRTLEEVKGKDVKNVIVA